MLFGLKDETVNNIQSVFNSFPEIEEVIIYGSRAKGNYKNGSDIDLTFKGELVRHNIVNKISLKLDDLFLPYTFDLSVFAHIKDDELLEHIQRVGKPFYQKLSLPVGNR